MKLYIVVGTRCEDCQDDGPELLGVFDNPEAATKLSGEWWNGACSRSYILEGQAPSPEVAA